MRRLLPTAALGLALCGGEVAAAQAPEPAAGTRVRVRLQPDGRRLDGRLVGAEVGGALTGLVRTEGWAVVPPPASTSSARRSGLTVRPKVGTMRVPVRGAPPARALTVGLTLRPR